MVTQSVEAAPARRVKPVVIRLRPDQIEQLRNAKFDYQARHREEVEETELLRQFFDECFEDWIKRSLQ